MWYDQYHPGVVYVDLRPEVRPDILCDSGQLPFRRRCFDLIVFDPPHHNIGANADMVKRYGHFTNAEIKWFVLRAFHDFARVLKKDGLILFKWSDHTTKLTTILGFICGEFTPLFGQLGSTRVKHPSMTYWVTLVKT